MTPLHHCKRTMQRKPVLIFHKVFSSQYAVESITPPIPSEWMGLAEEMTISSL